MAVVDDISVLPEFVPLPTRLTFSTLYCSPDTFGDVPALTESYTQQPSAAAAELTQDSIFVTRKHTRRYYNSWKSRHSASRARETDIVDAAELEGLRSLSDGDIATDDSNSVLSSSSYEQLGTRHAETIQIDEERFVSVSPASSDCESLVSVTPDTDSISALSSSPVSDVEDSLSDVSSLYNNAEVWSQTQSPLHGTGSDAVVQQRVEDKSIVSQQYLHADDPGHNVAHHTFDGQEIATIRMLELELLAADLSRQMLSVHKLMRLLSCETSQLANLITGERRHSVRAVLTPEQRNHGALVELSSDNEVGMTMAYDGEVSVPTQKALLSAVIDELKSVSVMMSNTLLSMTTGTSPTSRVLTVHSNTASIRRDGKTELPMAALDDFYHRPTENDHDQQLVCLSAAEADDDDDDDYRYDNNDKNDGTCTTKVSVCFRYSL